jgi:hypothetical protein
VRSNIGGHALWRPTQPRPIDDRRICRHTHTAASPLPGLASRSDVATSRLAAKPVSMGRWSRTAIAVALAAALVAACSAHLVSSVRGPEVARLRQPHNCQHVWPTAAGCSLLRRWCPPSCPAAHSPATHQALPSEGRSKYAVNALLALVSRAVADPKPVKDAHQAEELAHILKTVRLQPLLSLCAAPGCRCAVELLWLRGDHHHCLLRPIHAPSGPHSPLPSPARSPRSSGRTAWRCGPCPGPCGRHCPSSCSPGWPTASSATSSTASPAPCGPCGCTNVRRTSTVVHTGAADGRHSVAARCQACTWVHCSAVNSRPGKHTR